MSQNLVLKFGDKAYEPRDGFYVFIQGHSIDLAVPVEVVTVHAPNGIWEREFTPRDREDMEQWLVDLGCLRQLPNILAEGQERIEDLSYKIRFLLKFFRDHLEDRTFTFADGETWSAAE